MRFRSRVSVILFVLTLCVMLFACYKVIREGNLLASVVVVLITLAVIITFLGIRYTIEDDKLYIGFILYRGTCYDIHKLKSMKATFNPTSAPAASLKRLELDFGCGQPLVISPAAQDVFIDEILRINPNVTVN